jgi:serine/threonine-protein phosphatase 2B catalytic subunit
MTSTDKSRDATSASTPKYSTTERNCTTIPAPPARFLDIQDLFSNPSDSKDKPNLEKLKQHILLEGRLSEKAALRIIQTGKFSYILSNR